MFQHLLVACACAWLHVDVDWTMNCRDSHICPKNGFSQGQFDLNPHVLLAHSLEHIMILHIHCEEKVAGLRCVDICSVSHLRNFQLLTICEASRKLDFFTEDLSLDTNTFAISASFFWDATCTFTLRAPFLDVVVSNDATTATTLETLSWL